MANLIDVDQVYLRISYDFFCYLFLYHQNGGQIWMQQMQVHTKFVPTLQFVELYVCISLASKGSMTRLMWPTAITHTRAKLGNCQTNDVKHKFSLVQATSMSR